MKQRFDVDDKVIVVASKHAGVGIKAVGVIDSVMPDGYGVFLPVISRSAYFGGGGYTEEGIVFFMDDELDEYVKSDEHPVHYQMNAPSEKIKLLLKEMKSGALSLPRASWLLFRRDDSVGEVKAEAVLDKLWSKGLCACLGSHYDYVYILTSQGRAQV